MTPPQAVPSEAPLHVRVAEALGWIAVRPPRDYEKHGQWVGQAPARGHWGADIIPRFDESWRHTGPLIERYGIELQQTVGSLEDIRWIARKGARQALGPSPLIAVCNLLLALKAAGKL